MAFDLLLEFDWHGPLSIHETRTLFLVIAILWATCWDDPKRFSVHLNSVIEQLDVCEDEAIPVMVTTCKLVATTLLELPEAELGRKEKERAMVMVSLIYGLGFQEVHSICMTKMNVLVSLLQEQLADAEKKLEKRSTNSYTQIG